MPSFQKLQWLFPFAVVLHHAEEALYMPGWAAAHAITLPIHPNALAIRLVLLLLTVAAFVVTIASRRSGEESLAAYLLFGSASTMLINVFVPHVPAALAAGGYAPGAVTAVLINLPVMSLLLLAALRDRWVSGLKALKFSLLVPLTVAGSIVLLLALFHD